MIEKGIAMDAVSNARINGLDHIIVIVDDLGAWISKFEHEGFTVSERKDLQGESPEHRLVAFADSSYLELICVTPESTHAPDWAKRICVRGDGFGLWSVNVSDSVAFAKGLPAGHDVPPHLGGNLVKDEGEWKVSVIMPDEGDALIQPFCVEDIEGRDVRSPSGVARNHPNGATGISGITLVVPDLEFASSRLTGALGAFAEVPASSWSQGTGRRFIVGNQTVDVYMPQPGCAAADQLASRGPGIFSVQVSRESHAAQMELDLDTLLPLHVDLI